MNAGLGLMTRMYGVAVGLFYVTYVLLEVPSNLILSRVGARRWIARIMVSWGVVAAGIAPRIACVFIHINGHSDRPGERALHPSSAAWRRQAADRCHLLRRSDSLLHTFRGHNRAKLVRHTGVLAVTTEYLSGTAAAISIGLINESRTSAKASSAFDMVQIVHGARIRS
jgi:hypothetical protein